MPLLRSHLRASRCSGTTLRQPFLSQQKQLFKIFLSHRFALAYCWALKRKIENMSGLCLGQILIQRGKTCKLRVLTCRWCIGCLSKRSICLHWSFSFHNSKGVLSVICFVKSCFGKHVSADIVFASDSKSRMCLVFCFVSPQHKPHLLHSKSTLFG